MNETIRFYSVNQDGSERTELGTATRTPVGIEYENLTVRKAMAGMVRRFGEAKAWAFYRTWSNGYVCSEPVELAPPHP